MDEIRYHGHKIVWDNEDDECDCPLCKPLPVWRVDQCSKCGLQFSQVMMYVCPNIDCPCGLAGPVC